MFPVTPAGSVSLGPQSGTRGLLAVVAAVARERIIYMQSVDPAVPNSRAYPLEQVAERWGRRMLTSSAAYALALALLQGYRRIEVYGIELSSNTEYSYQLPGWAYWVGLATGAGADIILRSGERQFSAPLYGYEGERQIENICFVSKSIMQ